MREGWLGSTGGGVEIGELAANNRFVANDYFVTDLARNWWSWRPNGFVGWEGWRLLNFDATGTLTRI
jgi:hypothetical protein